MNSIALYARVSSDRQKQEKTIASQTIALIERAKQMGYLISKDWVFEDEGYSGAVLVRPGLEKLRDLAATGQIEAVLIYSPDRLSRKYAYQVLLIEELTRQGVEVIFIKSPKAETPEEHLLLQFQGMIAEYERAQIAERTRRGKRHKAKSGSINVLSGAPYGYRYVKKTEDTEAYYEIIPHQAEVVSQVFELYTKAGLSINKIARWLNEQQIATRTGTSQWCRSTVWGMLRIQPIKEKPALVKQSSLTDRKLHAPCVSVGVIQHVAVRIENVHRKNGLKFRFLHSLVNKPFCWPGNNWKTTSSLQLGVPRSRPCFKVCWSVSSAAMPIIEPRRAHRKEKFITIAV